MSSIELACYRSLLVGFYFLENENRLENHGQIKERSGEDKIKTTNNKIIECNSFKVG